MISQGLAFHLLYHSAAAGDGRHGEKSIIFHTEREREVTRCSVRDLRFLILPRSSALCGL